MMAAAHTPQTPPPAALIDATASDQDNLRRFALAMRASPIDILTRTIAQMCRLGDGFWQDPGTAVTSTRPATHFYEIHLFGQTAIGTTPEEAAHNWRTCALKQIEGEQR